VDTVRGICTKKVSSRKEDPRGRVPIGRLVSTRVRKREKGKWREGGRKMTLTTRETK